MRRLTILLAAVGALLLIPASQAFAFGTVTVDINGGGNGELNSEGGFFGEAEGEPPIECTYASPGPKSGTCATTMTFSEEETEEGIMVFAKPAPGSVFAGSLGKNAGWEVSGVDPTKANCTATGKFFGFNFCLVSVPIGTNPIVSITATFCLTGESRAECEGPDLTVALEGTGEGKVVSSPSGIACGAVVALELACTDHYKANTKVTLTASPASGSTFVSWKGCEKGGVNGRQCTVTMDAAKTVNAKFLTAYDVNVTRVGSGLGKVSSSPGGVLCLSNCSGTTALFKEGTSVTLTAAPSKNYVFTEWTGDCSGSSPTCSLGSLGANKIVGAKFTPVAQHNLGVSKSGGGNGTVKSNLAGINCGATCSSMAALYFQGQEVELTATPGKGSTFGGWSGSGCSGTGTCKVAISAAKSVTAEFK